MCQNTDYNKSKMLRRYRKINLTQNMTCWLFFYENKNEFEGVFFLHQITDKKMRLTLWDFDHNEKKH
jgi:hypothetical protein